MQNGIGDLSSKEAGSAARFNAGKPKLQLLPLLQLAKVWDVIRHSPPRVAGAYPTECLAALGRFQARMGSDQDNLIDAILAVGVPMDECADAYEHGILKYAAWNWCKGMPWSEMIGSGSRHLRAMLRGEEVDPDSGCFHKGQVMFNLICLLTYLTSYPEGDDRPYNLVKASGEAPDASRV